MALSGNGPYSSTFSDTPTAVGNYWYGIHVIDNANNYMDERIAGLGPKEVTVTSPDTTPPTPNPSTWATAPYATGTTSISMTATTASDPSGVQYYIHCLTTGGHDSGWQASPTYVDTGLSPNTTYTYQVMTRDNSPNQNQGSYSASAAATTQQTVDTTPPTPNPSTWATVPYATGTTSISMTATTASDPSGVQYYFHCLTTGGHDSGWQASPTYVDTGLSPNTTYTYQVMTRDNSPNQNQGSYSASAAATTQQVPDTTPPTPNPSTWATGPHATGTTSISMTATTASDPSGVQYYFHCLTTGGHDSGWQASATYVDTGLSPNTMYTYQVMTRDNSPNQNQGSYSASAAATTQQVANNPPQLSGIAMTNGVFRFVLNGPVGSNYVIQVSSNLMNWSAISTNTIPAGGSTNLSDPSVTNKSRRFYRAVPVAGVVAGRIVAWGSNSYGQTNAPVGTNWTAVAGGYYHSLALKADGTVVGWGQNDDFETNVPASLSNVTAIAAGWGTSLALKSDGTLRGWGWDGGYAITNTANSMSNITAISACWDCLMALRTNGTVTVWGHSTYGETNVPAGLNNVVAIAGGGYFCMALKGDGTVVVWGSNFAGQTNVPTGLSSVKAIAAGRDHCLALKHDGTVVAWGDNTSGQTNVPPTLAGVLAVSAGNSHSLALKADGTVAVWGDNSSGQTNSPVNLTNVVFISAGGFHNLAIKVGSP
ncbi:MAG: hypothetical protein ABSB84_11885 [Verrucomicrobiota bacterium]